MENSFQRLSLNPLSPPFIGLADQGGFGMGYWQTPQATKPFFPSDRQVTKQNKETGGNQI